MPLPRGWFLLLGLINAVSARGPLCLDCLAVDSPHECRTVTECGPQDSCFASHFIWSHGTHGFSFGCRYTDRCTDNNPPSKRLEAYRLCDSCCTGDLCNNNVCTNGTSPPIGLPCLQCDSISTTARCSHLTYCPEDHACFAEKDSLLENSLKLGCIPRAACSLLNSEIIGRRSTGCDSGRLRRVAACHKCCQEPGCNRDACVSVPTTSTQNYVDATTTTPIAATGRRNCWDIKVAANKSASGWYTVVSLEGGDLTVFCDMETDGGGWTVFQRRENGEVNFTRDYASYAKGFGSSKEFWMGNDKLHDFLSKGPSMRLRVDLCDWENKIRFAVYKTFNVSPGSQSYWLNVTDYFGNAGDALIGSDGDRKPNGQRFSTPDKDQDNANGNCADVYHSGWWFNRCCLANLNGMYRSQPTGNSGVEWRTWKIDYSQKTTEMKFRPSSAKPANHQPFICP